jgi:dTDP-4-amino-4,6-dideoxygalactose transaminase
MHGERTKYHHQVTGINSRLDSLQAAVLAVKLRYLEAWCEQRVQRAQIYNGLFTETGLLGEDILRIPPQTANRSHVFNNYVVRVRRRDQLKQYLAEQGIQSEVYYPVPLALAGLLCRLGYRKGDFLKRSWRRRSSGLAALSELTPRSRNHVVGRSKSLPPLTLRFGAAVIKVLPPTLPDR